MPATFWVKFCSQVVGTDLIDPYLNDASTGEGDSFHSCELFCSLLKSFSLLWQVENVGGTWRVGGLLALSCAFGDVKMH